MEQHPVPQNVTGFQFKLIGDMTIKQFGFLAAGVLLGYLAFQLDLPQILKWGVSLFCGFAGFAFAFLPIEERPLDTWLTSFIKSIYRPTRFLWKKSPVVPDILTPWPAFQSATFEPAILKKDQTAGQIKDYLASMKPVTNNSPIDQKEENFLKQTLSGFVINESPFPPVPPTPPSLPSSPVPPISLTPPVPPSPTASPDTAFEEKQKELAEKISLLQEKLESKDLSKVEFIDLQSRLSFLLKEKEKITREIVRLRKASFVKPKNTFVKPLVIPEISLAKAGLPQTPTVSNLPSGIVKTSDSRILPGILVEIRNTDGMAVRALKTGKLGQFSVTTPLPDGNYTVFLEDPQKTYFFDTIEIVLKGEPLQALEIIAKTKRDQERKELTKKIFSKSF